MPARDDKNKRNHLDQICVDFFWLLKWRDFSNDITTPNQTNNEIPRGYAVK